MILNIIKEMTNCINLASEKPVDLLVSITMQFLSFSLLFHFLLLFSLSLFFFTFILFFQCIPLLFIVNLTYIIKSTMIYVAGKGKHNKLCRDQFFQFPNDFLFNKKRGFPKVLRDLDSLYLKAEILYQAQRSHSSCHNITSCPTCRTTSATGHLFECYEDKLPETKARPS